MAITLDKLLNTATVSSTTYDPYIDNNVSSAEVDVEILADLHVNKSGPLTVIAGDSITYTITVTNHGPQAAENVELTDAIPAIIANPMFKVGDDGEEAPWTGSHNLGKMEANAIRVVTITGTVDYDALEGQLSNTSVVSSITPDPDEENNTSTAPSDVVTEADVEILKTASDQTVNPEDTLTYTLVVTNHGLSTARNVVVTDALPAELLDPQYEVEDVSSGPWEGSYTIGDMVPGDIVTIVITGTVASDAAGNLNNTANVASPTYDPDLLNNTSTANTDIEALADVAILKSASHVIVNPGYSLVYTLVITNHGPSIAENVVVTDVIPEDLIDSTFTVNGMPHDEWTGSHTIGTMPVDDIVTIIITSIVDDDATGTIRNTAIVGSTTRDPDMENNTSTTNTGVEALADVEIEKSASHAIVNHGDTLTYTLLVTNHGPSTAENVVVNDVLPAGLINPTFTVDTVSHGEWTGTHTIGSLLDEDTRTIVITGVIAADAPEGLLSNTATVTSTTPDYNLDNNTSTAETTVEAEADISVNKQASHDVVNPGDTLTYTLIVTNHGPSTAVAVTVTDPLPAGLLNPTFSVDGTPSGPWNGTHTIGNMLTGEIIEITITGTVDPDTSFFF